MSPATPTRWYCAALRSFATLLERAADHLDASRRAAADAVRRAEPADSINHTRDRILSRFH